MSELGNKSNIKEIVEWILCILIAIVLALLVRHFIFTPTVVRQTSMKTTMEPGDRLVLDRWSITTKKEIERGDIITFEKPSNADNNTNTDQSNPIASYDNEPKGIFSKFVYYILEMGKESLKRRKFFILLNM